MIRNRRVSPPFLLLVAALAFTGCRYDYFFAAFVIEGVAPYPPKEWTRVICQRFESSPFELRAGDYSLEFDMDIPSGVSGSFPRKLQAELRGYDVDDEMLFRYRTRRMPVDRATGRIEQMLTVQRDLVVPVSGEICLLIKPIGSAVIPGWLAGVLFEPVVGVAAPPGNPAANL
jgi:hypothetical protein